MNVIKYLGVFIFLFLVSCTNNMKVKVSDENALKYVDKICEKLDSTQCKNFKTNFKNVLMLGEYGTEARVFIISHFGKKYENLTLEDILNNPLQQEEYIE